MVLSIDAQNNNDILTKQSFITKTGSVCEETPDDNPCAGFEIFVILNFNKERVLILEKEVSSCGLEKITSKLDYKWRLTENGKINIYSNPKEIKYHFLKDLVLKIENKKIIGYKKREHKNTEKFEFDKITIL